MAAVMDVQEADAKLSQLLDRAAAGEEILIARNGVPVARLARLEVQTRRRVPGGWEHGVQIADDFDAPLPQLWNSREYSWSWVVWNSSIRGAVWARSATPSRAPSAQAASSAGCSRRCSAWASVGPATPSRTAADSAPRSATWRKPASASSRATPSAR